jgi:hypothetical protein
MRRLVLIILLALVSGCDRQPVPPSSIPPNATLTGTILERIDGPPYSFLRLDTEKGQVWVAVPMAHLERKSKITVKNGAVVRNFASAQAGRKFDLVVFGALSHE